MSDLVEKKDVSLQQTKKKQKPVFNTEVLMKNEIKIPIERIMEYGVGFNEIKDSLAKLLNKNENGSGLYRVIVDKGGHLAQTKNGTGLIGTVVKDGEGIVGQARLVPQFCDPTSMVMLLALANIEKKLDKISEVQVDMFSFIIQKEKSKMSGDLVFLNDIAINYKYNWNSEKFKAANYIKVLDVRQESETNIDFYQERIKKIVSKKSLFKNKKTLSKEIKDIKMDLEHYQLSVYLFAYSYFLEVLLQENYDSEYLKLIVSKIHNYSLEYREVYSKVIDFLNKSLNDSVDNIVNGAVVGAVDKFGKAIKKIPIDLAKDIGDGVDDILGDISKWANNADRKMYDLIIDKQKASVLKFVENIEFIDKINNQQMEIIIDNDYIYLQNDENKSVQKTM